MSGKTFESTLLRIEEIVRILENGELSLEESIKLFEEGTRLTADCQARLNEAELKIKNISKTPEEQ